MKSWYNFEAAIDDLTYYYDQDIMDRLGLTYSKLIRTQKWKNYKELYDITIFKGKVHFLQKQDKSNIRFENGEYKIYPAIVKPEFQKRIEVLK